MLKIKKPSAVVVTPEAWLLSADGETFQETEYTSEAAAVAAAPTQLALAPGSAFFVGRLEAYEPTVLGGETLDAVVDLAIEELGEDVVAGWLEDLPDEKVEDLEKTLSEAFKGWLVKEKLEPDFMAVAFTTEHKT